MRGRLFGDFLSILVFPVIILALSVLVVLVL